MTSTPAQEGMKEEFQRKSGNSVENGGFLAVQPPAGFEANIENQWRWIIGNISRLAPPSPQEGEGWEEENARLSEKYYLTVKPLVEDMKKRYPQDSNIEGFEPALTSDIAEIVGKIVASRDAALVEGILAEKKGISYDEEREEDRPTMQDEFMAMAFESAAEAWFDGFDHGLDTALSIVRGEDKEKQS